MNILETIRIKYNELGYTPDYTNAEYGCLGFKDKASQRAAELRTSGNIIPVDGYITWHLDESKKSDSIDVTTTKRLIEEGFKFIEPYLGKVKFRKVDSIEESQITIGFWKNGMSKLPEKFQQTTLAYAYLANNTKSFGLISDVFFNDAFIWGPTHGSKMINFKKVFVHEVLHALGCHHSPDISDILYPSYQPLRTMKITLDTASALKKLYHSLSGPVEETKDEEVMIDPKIKAFIKVKLRQIDSKIQVINNNLNKINDEVKQLDNMLERTEAHVNEI